MAQQMVLSTDSDGNEAELQDTKVLFTVFVFGNAKVDKELSSQECKTFEEAHKICSDSVPDMGPLPSASLARELLTIGDQIDNQLQDTIRKLAQRSGPPEQAFKMFNEVVKNMFSDGPGGQGGAKITTGRIIAVLQYSYQLCKHLASQNVAAARLASLVSTVATWLFKSFIEAKLYNWLRDVGGWDKLVAISRNTRSTVVGIVFVAILAIAYFSAN